MDPMYPAQMPIPTAPPPSMYSMPQPGMPIVSQGGWSPPSTTCPPGLEYLMGLSHLFVQQKVELLEAFSGFETKNKYSVANIRGEQIFYVAEKSGFCGRLCLGASRSCKFLVFDNNRREVLRMVRPFRCNSCCCPCCLQSAPSSGPLPNMRCRYQARTKQWRYSIIARSGTASTDTATTPKTATV